MIGCKAQENIGGGDGSVPHLDCRDGYIAGYTSVGYTHSRLQFFKMGGINYTFHKLQFNKVDFKNLSP